MKLIIATIKACLRLAFIAPVLLLLGVTPKYGTMMFRGVLSKQTFPVDVYIADVANALIHWDGGAGAGTGSPAYWRAPEPCVLEDYAQVTGPTVTMKLRLNRNGVPIGGHLRYDTHVSTLANRPKLNIPFMRGDEISAIEIAD